MPAIRVLSEDVARRIAAGEVVERPASVVKELIENALDAGATEVSIRTEKAGGGLIEVRDNGSGMSVDDLRLAPQNFSTSKITEADDLVAISTYGFRGEALASISAVSRFEIITSDDTGGEGWRLVVEGKSMTDPAPAPHERGTTIRVRDLFFNTPARRKFLKTDMTERRRILETILSFAMVAPDIEFHYSDDGKRTLDLISGTSWRDRIAALLGASVMKHMIDIEFEDGPQRVRGFVSLPAHTRGNRNHQYYFINHRMVRDRTIMAAVQEAYRSVVPFKRYPVTVLSLELPFEDVDVNVHPNKLEVRLRHDRRVFDLIRRAIRQSLSGRTESAAGVGYPTASVRSSSEERPHGDREAAAAALPFPSAAPGSYRADAYRARVRDAFESYTTTAPARHDLSAELSLKTAQPAETSSEQTKQLKEKVGSEESLFWQFNNAFIFIQVRGGIVVIDQHAAHERIIFETSRKRLANEIPVSQQILFPIPLELSVRELDVFRGSQDVFRKLGFHLEPFGGTSILVRGYPQGLKNWDEGRLLLQILDDIVQERVPGASHTDKIIASFACHSAVRAGQKLSVGEMRMLADQLFAVENPHSCPHGRPTIHQFSVRDVESWFHR